MMRYNKSILNTYILKLKIKLQCNKQLYNLTAKICCIHQPISSLGKSTRAALLMSQE
jgi:hypothetical protein